MDKKDKGDFDEGDKHNSDDDCTQAFDSEQTVTSDDLSDKTFQSSKSEKPISLPNIKGYKILNILGKGGMGVVYEAEQQNPKRKVALKVMLHTKATDDTFVRMFEREVETLARLTHPNIGGIYESGRTDDGQYFFAMEIVKGKTLDQYLRDSISYKLLVPSDVRSRLMLFHKIVNAVHYAHQRGVIHRDLKPSNIIVSDEQTSGSSSRSEVTEIKILDFGLARITDTDVQMTQVTEIGVIKGTLAYMSPEQARGNPNDIDVRSDVYSLGVILYQMLSGKLPKEIAGSMLEAIRVITETNAKPLEEIFRGKKRLDPDIVTICHKALELTADDRYGSASAMAEDIERYLTNQPIQARPPSTVYQLKKMITRNKLTTSFVATVFFLLIGLAVTMSVLQGEAETARAEAEKRADELEIVTEFQSSMLSDIDAEAMGLALYDDLSSQVKESLEGDSLSAKIIETALNNFDNALSRTNATNIALTLIDEQILQRAVETIEEEFVEQPLTRASLSKSVGETYMAIGIYSQALPLMDKALETRRRILGDDHLETLSSISNMGSLFQYMGKYDEALVYYQEALDGYRHILGNDLPRTLTSMRNMGSLFQDMGQYDKALVYHQEALDGYRRIFGNDHLKTFMAIGDVGTILTNMGKYDEALVYFQEDLDVSRRAHGDDDPLTLTSISNMGILLIEMGKYDEALVYSQEALNTCRRVFGDNHQQTLISINSMGALLYYLERTEEALVYAQEALDGRRRNLGNDHPQTLMSINNMGALFQTIGKYDEALVFYQEALGIQRRNLGDDHPSTLITITNIGTLVSDMSKYDEALVYAQEALDGYRRIFGNDHIETLLSINNMGTSLELVDKQNEALIYYQEALEGFRRVLDDDHLYTLNSMKNLGDLLVEMNQTKEAKALLIPNIDIAREILVGSHSWRLGVFLSALGRAHSALGEFNEADKYLIEANEILFEVQGTQKNNYKKVLNGLIEHYITWNKAEPQKGHDKKAAEWKTKLTELQAESKG